ncbi:hypothetical protein [Mycobacterium simiae]|uniref:hypothetical protein n=1 Tax=Mycobacterium simiae TaxID=1784 RepID=UPI00165FD07D|nr:hypothetical protein [Mycobacterium simiae]
MVIIEPTISRWLSCSVAIIELELARPFIQPGYDLVVAAEDDAINAVPETWSQWGVAVQPPRP